jgi:P27 family predicted phage terminase small subunit
LKVAHICAHKQEPFLIINKKAADMGQRGPKPKPANVLALSGSRQMDKRKHRIAASLVRAVPEPPEWLSVEAREQFARLGERAAGIGAVAEVDGDALAMTAEALVDFLRVRDILRRDGETYMTVTPAGSEMLRPHPLMGERAKLWQIVVRGLGLLGLTPPSREGRNPLPDEIIGGEDRDGGVELSV